MEVESRHTRAQCLSGLLLRKKENNACMHDKLGQGIGPYLEKHSHIDLYLHLYLSVYSGLYGVCVVVYRHMYVRKGSHVCRRTYICGRMSDRRVSAVCERTHLSLSQLLSFPPSPLEGEARPTRLRLFSREGS